MAQQQAMQVHKVESTKDLVTTQMLKDDLDVRKAALLQPIEGAKYAPG